MVWRGFGLLRDSLKDDHLGSFDLIGSQDHKSRFRGREILRKLSEAGVTNVGQASACGELQPAPAEYLLTIILLLGPLHSCGTHLTERSLPPQYGEASQLAATFPVTP